jgi:tRNA threonylcarbamoyladenosine biosynthesis protein TsaB
MVRFWVYGLPLSVLVAAIHGVVMATIRFPNISKFSHLCDLMALILQLETATTSCSVALALNGEVLSLKQLNERNAHASHLTQLIEAVLAEAGKTMQDLQAVAVSMGPGSYTGLRIGVSTAKGLCYALDIPLIAVNTLEAMAQRLAEPPSNSLYCPMIDARRMEVYCAIYDSSGKEVLPVGARIIDAASFSDYLSSSKVVFFGDGAMKCQDVLIQAKKAVFVADFVNSAQDLTALAWRKYVDKAFEDVAYFEPFYLKDFLVTQPKPIS